MHLYDEVLVLRFPIPVALDLLFFRLLLVWSILPKVGGGLPMLSITRKSGKTASSPGFEGFLVESKVI